MMSSYIASSHSSVSCRKKAIMKMQLTTTDTAATDVHATDRFDPPRKNTTIVYIGTFDQWPRPTCV